MPLLGRLGHNVTQRVTVISGIAGILVQTLREFKSLRYRSHIRIFVLLFKRQLFNIGFKSAYINALIAFILVWAMLSRVYSYIPTETSFTAFYSQFFVLAVIRELGPIISGFILIARSANAITAEVGYLKLHNEFEVLSSLNMSVVFVLFLPVLCAFPIALLLMFIYFDAFALLASYIFVIAFYDENTNAMNFFTDMVQYITPLEVTIVLLKGMFGGVVIALVSLYFGSQVGDRFTDVSRAISSSTTVQVLMFFVLSVSLSFWAYQ